ncbi:MAG: hypothetical protein ACR2HB_08885 [Dehalococcoidia bacterium]
MCSAVLELRVAFFVERQRTLTQVLTARHLGIRTTGFLEGSFGANIDGMEQVHFDIMQGEHDVYGSPNGVLVGKR